MAIAVVSWLQNRVGCNILGDIRMVPAGCWFWKSCGFCPFRHWVSVFTKKISGYHVLTKKNSVFTCVHQRKTCVCLCSPKFFRVFQKKMCRVKKWKLVCPLGREMAFFGPEWKNGRDCLQFDLGLRNKNTCDSIARACFLCLNQMLWSYVKIGGKWHTTSTFRKPWTPQGKHQQCTIHFIAIEVEKPS